MSKLGAIILAAGLLALGGCSAGADDGEDAAATPVALVGLAPATQGRIAQTVALYGEVERGGENQVVLPAPVEATVEQIVVPLGAAMHAGQLVANLRPSPGTQALASAAAAQARTAAQALARAQRLRADGLASDADVEAARAAAATAAAQAATLSRQISSLVLRAPRAGYVVALGANPGDLVAPGTAVATLSTGGPQVARFGADPATAAKLSPGMPLEVTNAAGGAAMPATIASISPVADAQTRLATIVVRLPAAQGLAAGQALTARVPVAASGDAVTIPYAALLDDGGQPFVYVVEQGVAHRHDVVTGATDGTRIAVLKGVAPGQQVVIAGGTGVEDGMKVRTK